MADGKNESHLPSAIRHLASSKPNEVGQAPNGTWPALRIAHWQGVNGPDSVWW